MKKILVVDDEKEIVKLLSIYLKNENYEVFQAFDGQEAIDVLAAEPDIALMILDIMMPNKNGMQVVSKLRKEDNSLPIIFLSARSEDMDKIRGLVLGADDYITKPFHPLEVMARVKTVLRRLISDSNSENSGEIYVGELTIRPNSHEVINSHGEPIYLTALEFEIFYLLASNAGRVFSAEEIFERIWKQKVLASTKTVMVHVSHLRDKLMKGANGIKVIQTVWGVGYKIEKN